MAEAIDRGAVAQALQEVRDPANGRSIVETGAVQKLAIFVGAVVFELHLEAPDSDEAAQLKRHCEETLRALPGVEKVAVRLKKRESQAQAEPAESGLKDVRFVVAVASGKGGVGKSTASVNLAAALSRKGARVGLLDADIYGPSVPTMLRIDEGPRQGEGNRIRPAMAQGIKVISMDFFLSEGKAAIMRGPMVSGTVMQFLNAVDWGELDYLVVDYPPGTGDIQLTLSQQAPISGAVVVTTPQEISLVDVERALRMFEKTEVPVLGIAEQMSYFICDDCGKRHHIFRNGGGRRIAEHFGLPFLAEVPIDPKVPVLGDRGLPPVLEEPESPVGRAYLEMAEAVASQLEILSEQRGECLEQFRMEWRKEA